MKHHSFLIVALAFTAPAFAQQPDVEWYVREHQPAIIREFMGNGDAGVDHDREMRGARD